MISSPAAILGRSWPFCSSLPASMTGTPPRTTVEMYGPGTSARPNSSSSTTSSHSFMPVPPCSSGMINPIQPCCAIFRHTSGESPFSSSSISRTTDSGHSFSRKSRAKFFSSSCCSSSPRSMGAVPPSSGHSLPRQSEAAHRYNVLLYLRRAATNAHPRLPQVLPLELAPQRHVLRLRLKLAVQPHDLHAGLRQPHLHVGVEQLRDGRLVVRHQPARLHRRYP